MVYFFSHPPLSLIISIIITNVNVFCEIYSVNIFWTLYLPPPLSLIIFFIIFNLNIFCKIYLVNIT